MRVSLAVMLIISLASIAGGRSDTPRDLDTHHLFTPPATRADWEKRADAIRKRILVSCGLWPMPARTPLNPMVTGKIEAPDYTIENVALRLGQASFFAATSIGGRARKVPSPVLRRLTATGRPDD